MWLSQGPYEVCTVFVHCSSAFLKLSLLDGTFQLVVVCQGSSVHEVWALSILVPLLQKAASYNFEAHLHLSRRLD